MANEKNPFVFFEATKENIASFGKHVVVIEPPPSPATKWLDEYNAKRLAERSSVNLLTAGKDYSDSAIEPIVSKPDFIPAKNLGKKCNCCDDDVFLYNEKHNVILDNNESVSYCAWCHPKGKVNTCKRCGKYHETLRSVKFVNSKTNIGERNLYCAEPCEDKPPVSSDAKYYYCICCFKRSTSRELFGTMSKDRTEYLFCKYDCLNRALLLLRDENKLASNQCEIIHMRYLHKEKNI